MQHRYLSGVVAACLVCLVGICLADEGTPQQANAAFPLGVSAGDVTSTSAVLWTRTSEPGTIVLEVTAQSALGPVIHTASADAVAEHDLTVKFVVEGLAPWQPYYYRFHRQDTPLLASRTGTFRTAPDPDQPQEFTFAFSGDANQAFQPFFLLDSTVADKPDFFIFDGDTIYADYFTTDVATDLAGYRRKYQGNRDSYMQDLTASTAVWPMWDDHEVANNYAGIDDPKVASYVLEAYQAFFEYMPITPSETFRTYRSIRYGSLAEFFFLDGRQYRSPEAEAACGNALDPMGLLLEAPDAPCLEVLNDPSRTMLGPEQLAWLLSGLQQSTARWKFIVSSVPMTTFGLLPYDNWDGYPAERLAIWQFIQQNGIENVAVLSADAHLNAYVPDVTHYVKSAQPGVLPDDFHIPEIIACPIAVATFRQEAVALGAQALGLPADALFVRIPMELLFDYAAAKLRRINDMRFLRANRYGYLLMHVGQDKVSFEIKGISPKTDEPTPARVMFKAALPQKSSPLPCSLLALLPMAGLAAFAKRFLVTGRT